MKQAQMPRITPTDQLGGALRLQRKTAGEEAADAVTPITQGGQLLEPRLRAEMEGRFGESFDGVRIHSDSEAARSAGAAGANAYTFGQHVVFAEQRYAPDKSEGKRLLAHELAHVVQQSRGGPAPDPRGDAALERAAGHAATEVMNGTSAVTVYGASGPGIACDEDPAKPRAVPREIYQAPVTGRESQDEVRRMFAARGIYFRGGATWVKVGNDGYWHLQDWQVIARDTEKTLNMRADPIQATAGPKKPAPKPTMTKESIRQKHEENWQAAKAGMWDTAVDTVVTGGFFYLPSQVTKPMGNALKSGSPKTTGDFARDRELQENYEGGGMVTDTVVLASSFVPIGEIVQGARLVAGKAPALVGTGNLGGGKLIGFSEQWAAEAKLATKAEQLGSVPGQKALAVAQPATTPVDLNLATKAEQLSSVPEQKALAFAQSGPPVKVKTFRGGRSKPRAKIGESDKYSRLGSSDYVPEIIDADGTVLSDGTVRATEGEHPHATAGVKSLEPAWSKSASPAIDIAEPHARIKTPIDNALTADLKAGRISAETWLARSRSNLYRSWFEARAQGLPVPTAKQYVDAILAQEAAMSGAQVPVVGLPASGGP